jgi:DHA2 family multidrug resistance protein
MQSFVRTITVAISTSVVLTFWSHGQRTANVGLAASLDPGVVRSTLDGAGLAGQPGTVTLANAVDIQARTIALDKTFLIAALIQVFVVVLIWFAPRVRMRGMDEAALAH